MRHPTRLLPVRLLVVATTLLLVVVLGFAVPATAALGPDLGPGRGGGDGPANPALHGLPSADLGSIARHVHGYDDTSVGARVNTSGASLSSFRDAYATSGNVPRFSGDRGGYVRPQYSVGRHGDMPSPRPAGHQSHRGVNSVWGEANVPGYRANDAPAVLMPNTPDHNATRGVFNRWRSEIAGRQGVRPNEVDWSAVSPGEAWRLAEDQFAATNVSSHLVDDYFQQFNDYIGGR